MEAYGKGAILCQKYGRHIILSRNFVYKRGPNGLFPRVDLCINEPFGFVDEFDCN